VGSPVQQVIQHVAENPNIQVPATGASLLTMGAAWLEKIHGPMATIGVILGACWVALQIYLAVEKRWFPRKKK